MSIDNDKFQFVELFYIKPKAITTVVAFFMLDRRLP